MINKENNDGYNDLNAKGKVKLSKTEKVSTDDDFNAEYIKNKTDSLNEHDKQYTKLLGVYVANSEKSLFWKKVFKIVFFFISCIILLLTISSTTYLMIIIILSDDVLFDKMIQIAPVLLTFMTPLLVLPNAITKYLFNTVDENAMINIVSKIIEHDDKPLKHV